MVGVSLAMSTPPPMSSAHLGSSLLKKRPADEALLDPDRTVDRKRSRTDLKPGLVKGQSIRSICQPHATDSLRGLQAEQTFQVQLERSISLILTAQGFDGSTQEALESFRAMTEQFQLHFLSIVHSSMTISHRTTPVPHDFIVALQHFNLSPSDLTPHAELPPAPLVTQPSIQVDLTNEIQPVTLDKVLGSDLIISASISGSDGPSAHLITPQKRREFSKYIPKHLPELPSLHTWQTTDIWPTERHEQREDGEAEARRMRERATEEGIMAEQALRRLLMASKKVAPSSLTNSVDGSRPMAPKTSKLKSIWESAKNAISEMDQDAKAQEEAEEAAAVAEFEDPVLDLTAALEQEPAQPAKLRKARAMLEEEEEREDGAEGMLSIAVNCDKRYWRESARGRH